MNGEIAATIALSFISGWFCRSAFRNIQRIHHSVTRDTKLVFIVRTDLGMGKGKIASQCSHAAVSCYKTAQDKYPDVLKKWELSGQPKIVLKLDTGGEEALKKFQQKAQKEGLVCCLIRDAGHTQVMSGSATVLGIGPGCTGKIDSVTSSLKLL